MFKTRRGFVIDTREHCGLPGRYGRDLRDPDDASAEACGVAHVLP
ncbi:MAG TPA: hypothetical protein VNB91_15195 [Jatrophihabitantaceae bacterium]|nr:hypothetical protein [Jatrophihabitantaceae bacterium]